MKDHNHDDLRSFLKEAEQKVGLHRITRAVDVNTELPALCSETKKPILFENLKGYEGYRVVDCLLRDRTLQALAFKCPRETLVQEYARVLGRGPGPTCLLPEGPVKEIIRTGDAVNLKHLPAVTPSEGIEVPHMELKPADFHIPIISSGIVTTKDPHTNVHNCAYSMAAVVDEKCAHCYLFSAHTNRNIAAYTERGEKAPMALVIGCHPAYELAAVYTGPHEGHSEYALAAGIFNEAVALVQCETVDLQVPAYAEIIIEGYIGPEHHRYLHTSAHTDTHGPIVSYEPCFDVTAITMRRDPIYRHIQPTRFTDHHAICEFMISPLLLAMLQGKGINAHDVSVPMHSCINCAVIQMTPTCREEVKEALLTALTMPFLPRLAIAVDEDIDIHDLNDIIYALSVRVQPERGIVTLDGVRSFDLEPTGKIIPGLEQTTLRSGGRYGIDATKPPLCEPQERLRYQRLRARGEGKVFLKDFLDS
ncbi:MAG: UbiD family decarboxylase domain-containing protein [Gammaproteobacteria bacterium]